MRKLFFSLIVPVMLLAACEEKHEPTNKNLLPTDLVTNPRTASGTDSSVLLSLPKMEFKDTVRDFGTIQQGEIVTMEYDFTNTGKTPLIIASASGSCGCTVADFPREPLAPGKSSSIKVQFSSVGKEGHQDKSVAITTNSDRGIHILYIKGEIKK